MIQYLTCALGMNHHDTYLSSEWLESLGQQQALYECRSSEGEYQEVVMRRRNGVIRTILLSGSVTQRIASKLGVNICITNGWEIRKYMAHLCNTTFSILTAWNTRQSTLQESRLAYKYASFRMTGTALILTVTHSQQNLFPRCLFLA